MVAAVIGAANLPTFISGSTEVPYVFCYGGVTMHSTMSTQPVLVDIFCTLTDIYNLNESLLPPGMFITQLAIGVHC